MLFQAMCGVGPGKCLRFHLFEEVEHAAVTVQCQKQNTTALERFLLYPFAMGMMLPRVFHAVLPPLFNNPSLLLKRETYPQLLAHTTKATVSIFGTLLSILLHWVLPIPLPRSIHDLTHAHFENECKRAGVEWEVT